MEPVEDERQRVVKIQKQCAQREELMNGKRLGNKLLLRLLIG